MNAVVAGIRKYLAAGPRTKREEDLGALTLFCLLSFILVGLIAVGMALGRPRRDLHPLSSELD